MQPLWTTARQRRRLRQCSRRPILPQAHVLSSRGSTGRRACCRNACRRFSRRRARASPGANIKNILAMNVAVDKRFGPYLALSYSRFYPDITFEQALRPEALDAARQIVNLCDFLPPEDPERIEALAATFDGPALATSSNKALQARLEQNTADGPIQAPVVIAQGLSDIVVPSSATDAYVEERCSAGQRLEYWTFAGRDHITIVQPGTPLEELLIRWTTARFANEPQASGCVHKSF